MVSGGSDDDYLYDDGFDGYIETTVDPGPWMLFGTTMYCLATVLALPILVVWGKKRQREKWLREEVLFAGEQEVYHDHTVPPIIVRKDGTAADQHDAYNNNKNDSHIIQQQQQRSNEHEHEQEQEQYSQQSKSVTFSHHRPHGHDASRATAEAAHSDNNSVVERGLAKLANVTRYVNQAVDQVSYGYHSYAGRSEVSVGSRTSRVSSRSARSASSTTSSLLRSRGVIKPHQRRSKSRISSRSAALHKQIFNEEREDVLTSPPVEKSEDELALRYDQQRYNNKRSSFAVVSNSGMSQSYMAESQYVSTLAPDDAVDANDPGKVDYLNSTTQEDVVEYDICCGPNPIWNPALIVRGMSKVVDLAEYDKESQRLIKLAIPMTISEVMDTVFENVQLALIGRNISTDAVAAYAIAGLFIELTDTFIKGIPDAENTVCSHAIGCKNFYLAGQYVQIAAVLYVLLSIPLFGVWYFVMDDAIMWLGLSERIAKMGAEYTKIAIIPIGFEGIAEAFMAILDITDHEDFVAYYWVGSAFLETATIAFYTIKYDADLVDVAYIQLIIGFASFVLALVHSFAKGWYKRYMGGIFGNFAFKNTQAVKTLFGTSIPLMFGQLVAYGEWEVLTIFAAHLGSAEVAAWAILSSIWDMFESSTEGTGEAVAIRIAHHLGHDNPAMAEIATYKSSLLAMIFAFLLTAIFFIAGDNIPVWFTKDATLQNLISQTLPLIGIGNISMTFGMIAWNQLGGQGRYRVATLIHLGCSWFITLPLAALFTYVFNFNLEGIVGAVVIGFSSAGMLMAYCLLTSNWERISIILQELNALEDDSDSDDSSSDDSDDSSSDDSDSSSSDDSSDDSSSSSSSEHLRPPL